MQVAYPAHQIRADLDRQRMEWRFIETTARIVCRGEANQFLSTLVGTRVAFEDLCNELALGLERARLANQRRDLLARAQAAIDILVRNLFERTADVGFIATDASIVAYLGDPASQDAAALQRRLSLYRSFYSVYTDIALINTQGKLIWRLTDGVVNSTSWPSVPMWFDACLGADGYVEVYEAHAWWGADPALIYGHRVLDDDGRVLGVVALHFALTEELSALRAEVLGDQPEATLAFVNSRGQVLQSSNGSRLPGGSIPRTNGDPPWSVRVGKDDYPMAQTISPGYQGYSGPGWRAWVLAASAQGNGESATDLPSLQQAQLELQSILARAQETAADLRLVLFNGKVTETGVQDVAALRVVLDQIGLAGTRTLELFDRAIGSLTELLENGLQAQVMAQARLAVSILDRNLYERANDCRWWSLNAVFCQTLQAVAACHKEAADLSAQAQPVLSHLNDLYTVYRQVALFDVKGQVLAVSRPGVEPHPHHIGAEILNGMGALRAPKDYLAVRPVSPQENADVWTYVAAVRAPDGRVVGGVALYFETRRELTGMLEAVCVGAGWTGAAYRIGATQWIVETSEATASQPLGGGHWPLPDSATSLLGQHGTTPVLAGVARSQGYREFLRSDGHTEWVSVLLLHADRRFEVAANHHHLTRYQGSGATRSFGVVRVGNVYLGFDVAVIRSALRLRRWVATPVSPPALGAVEASDGSTWPLLDARLIHGQVASPISGVSVGLVLCGAQADFVWLFDELVGVVVAPLTSIAMVWGRQAPWITAVLKEEGDEVVRVQLVDLSKIPLELQALQPG